MPVVIIALVPAEPVAVVLEIKGPCRQQRLAASARELVEKPVVAEAIERVFETGAMAVLAISEIALDAHHDFGELGCFCRGDESKRFGQTRIAVGTTVELAHAAANADIETNQCAVIDNSDEAEILPEHVDVVDRRNGKPDLEFARQIKVAIDRFLRRDLRRVVAVPDLGVAAGAGNQAVAGGAGEAGNFVVHSADKRIGTADDAPAVIAAGGDGVQAEIAKPLYQSMNVALANAVQLHGLARGDPDTALGVAARQSVDALPLRAAENPAGYAKAHHELKQRFE